MLLLMMSILLLVRVDLHDAFVLMCSFVLKFTSCSQNDALSCP